MNNIKTTEGQLPDAQGRFGIVAARFNKMVAERLLDGAVGVLRQHGIADENLHIVWVPGAFEIPLAVRQLAAGGSVDAVVALGCIIRGATPHFDYVAGTCSDALGRLQTEYGIPVGFGVLTVEHLEQALERAGSKPGNKGADAALAALEMASLVRQLS
ncbi:MAG: 6,7-dimethyl-8-ribityllumazine synthase [Gammaproteobacteria bacterium]|nr:6,7-dimethyl-8-ribityllumazine synthase [Gammaproteobacteria bacterium]